MRSYDSLTVYFKALAHPMRLQILDMLRRGEMCVCHIEAALGKRQAYVSQQMMLLREAGLVDTRKEGLQVFYRLTDSTISDLLEVVLGPVTEGFGVIEDCRCPQCRCATMVQHLEQGERQSRC